MWIIVRCYCLAFAVCRFCPRLWNTSTDTKLARSMQGHQMFDESTKSQKSPHSEKKQYPDERHFACNWIQILVGLTFAGAVLPAIANDYFEYESVCDFQRSAHKLQVHSVQCFRIIISLRKRDHITVAHEQKVLPIRLLHTRINTVINSKHVVRSSHYQYRISY